METYYVRLQKPPQGANHATKVGGRSAAKNWTKLNAIATELNIKPLQDFVAGTKETWFAPSEALATIRKLVTRISADKRGFEDMRLLVRDLQGYENILTSAEARNSKFYFHPESD
jgi:hypothetical protein